MGGTDDSGDRSRRIVAGTGRGLDKRDRFETAKHVSSDWDIQKLSLLGPILWSVVLVLLVLGTLVWAAFRIQGLLGLVSSVVAVLSAPSAESVNQFVLSRSLELVVAVILFRWLAPRIFWSTRDVLAGIKDKAVASLYQIRHLGVIFNLDTWSNHNYWHPFTSHLSDRDPLVVLSNAEVEATVSGIYTDVPYYRNVFVDSIYVTFSSVPDRTTDAELSWFSYRPTRARTYLFGAAIALLFLTRFPDVFGVVPRFQSVPWTGIELISTYGLIGYITVTGFAGYTRFRRRFFGNSAGFSEYGLLRSTAKTTFFEEDEESVDRLGNSLFGYGLFYVSEFLWEVVSPDAGYRVQNRVDAGESSHRRLARLAGTELLERAIPTRTLNRADANDEAPTIDVELRGVDYLRQDVTHRRSVGRLPVLGPLYGRSVGDGNERGIDTAGSRRGVRLPVKRFISVPDPISADHNLEADESFPFYFDDTWDEDEVHYLLMGGAEHQEALAKFIQYLRHERGYQNVNLLENAFTDEDDLQFVSEYFVSSVVRGDEDFRSPADEDGEVFLAMRHRMDDDRIVHVLYGMGALESKMAFLFWLDAFPTFDYDEDVLYRVRYDDIEEDVGRLYVDPSWLTDPERTLEFDWNDDSETTLVADDADAKTMPCNQVDVDVTYHGNERHE